MIDFINAWAQRIIIVIVICTIIEMILPEGKNKKYVKTVAGIYVVFTIIGPIISKINLKEKIDLEKYLKTPSNNTMVTSVNLDNNQYIEEVYKEKLGLDLKAKIKELGYEVKFINIEIETKDEETYGKVKALDLIVAKTEEKQENKIKIEPVEIDTKNVPEENNISQEEIETITNYLGEIYYLDRDKIKIK